MNEYLIEYLDGKTENITCDYIEVLSGGSICFWNEPENHKKPLKVGTFHKPEAHILLLVLNVAKIQSVRLQEVSK